MTYFIILKSRIDKIFRSEYINKTCYPKIKSAVLLIMQHTDFICYSYSVFVITESSDNVSRVFNIQQNMSYGPPEFLNIMNKVAKHSNINNIDYTVQFGYEEIDCYLGGIFKVRLKGYRDGQKIKKSYIIKWHEEPKRTGLRESYKREYLFFQTIVPKLLEVEKTFKLIEGLKIKFPNCVFASVERSKEVIVIANLQNERYIFHDRVRKLDLDHVSLVMKNLAKLHALSFVLEKSQPGKFEEIKKSCCTDVQYSNMSLMSKSLVPFYNASVNIVKDDKARKKLQDCASDILLILNKCAMPNWPKYLSICHGDCWNNNVLFKYQKKKPVDVIFVDYQLVRYASPVTDISYYLYMSTDQQFLSEHYERVITLYYKTLSAVLRQCGLDPREIYPEHIFREQLIQYSVFGLIEALVSMKIITAVTEEAVKMIEAKYECSEDGCYVDNSQESMLYVDRVNGVVNDFFSRNYSLNAVLKK